METGLDSALAGLVVLQEVGVVAYGHAERTLAAIRLLETQTAELLCSLPQLDAEQSSWLKESAEARRGAVNVLQAKNGKPADPQGLSIGQLTRD